MLSRLELNVDDFGLRSLGVEGIGSDDDDEDDDVPARSLLNESKSRKGAKRAVVESISDEGDLPFELVSSAIGEVRIDKESREERELARTKGLPSLVEGVVISVPLLELVLTVDDGDQDSPGIPKCPNLTRHPACSQQSASISLYKFKSVSKSLLR